MRALVAVSLTVSLAACGQLLALDEFHGDAAAGTGATGATSTGGAGDAGGGGSGSGGAPECTVQSDCVANTECQSSSCEGGICVVTTSTTATPCGNGGTCDGQGTCAEGTPEHVGLFAGGEALGVAAIDGGMIVVGRFTNTLALGTPGLATGDTTTPYADGFAARVNVDGTVAWVTQIGFKDGREEAHAVAVSEDEGLVYVGGVCAGDLYVNGSPLGDCGYTDTGGYDGAFVVALSPNDGKLSADFEPWFRKTAGVGDEVRGLALDLQGGLVAAGTGAIDGAGGTQPFVARLDQKTGKEADSHSLSASGAFVRGLAASGDSLFVTGAFSGSLFVGSSELAAVGKTNDLFVAKLVVDDSGELFAIRAVSLGTDGDDTGYALAIAHDGSVYVGGAVQGSLGKPALPLPMDASEQGVILFLEPELLTPIEVGAIAIAKGGTTGVRALAFDDKHNLLVTGWTDGIALSDSNGRIVSPPGQSSGFFAKYASDGALLYRHLVVGSVGQTSGRGLAASLAKSVDDKGSGQFTHLVGLAQAPLTYAGVAVDSSAATGTHALIATLRP